MLAHQHHIWPPHLGCGSRTSSMKLKSAVGETIGSEVGNSHHYFFLQLDAEQTFEHCILVVKVCGEINLFIHGTRLGARP